MTKLIKRTSFGRIKERGTMPHFLEFQLNSYEDFLQAKKDPTSRENKGLESAFKEIFPIESSNGDIKLDYVGYELHERILGRVIAEDLYHNDELLYPRDTMMNEEIAQIIVDKGVRSVKIRSPLT